jgi:hypothetical protein
MDHWRCRPSLAGLADALTNLDALSTDRLPLSWPTRGPRSGAHQGLPGVLANHSLPSPAQNGTGPSSGSKASKLVAVRDVKVKAFSDDTDVNGGLAQHNSSDRADGQ